jgi:hypothetical protein
MISRSDLFRKVHLFEQMRGSVAMQFPKQWPIGFKNFDWVRTEFEIDHLELDIQQNRCAASHARAGGISLRNKSVQRSWVRKRRFFSLTRQETSASSVIEDLSVDHFRD